MPLTDKEKSEINSFLTTVCAPNKNRSPIAPGSSGRLIDSLKSPQKKTPMNKEQFVNLFDESKAKIFGNVDDAARNKQHTPFEKFKSELKKVIPNNTVINKITRSRLNTFLSQESEALDSKELKEIKGMIGREVDALKTEAEEYFDEFQVTNSAIDGKFNNLRTSPPPPRFDIRPASSIRGELNEAQQRGTGDPRQDDNKSAAVSRPANRLRKETNRGAFGRGSATEVSVSAQLGFADSKEVAESSAVDLNQNPANQTNQTKVQLSDEADRIRWRIATGNNAYRNSGSLTITSPSPRSNPPLIFKEANPFFQDAKDIGRATEGLKAESLFPQSPQSPQSTQSTQSTQYLAEISKSWTPALAEKPRNNVTSFADKIAQQTQALLLEAQASLGLFEIDIVTLNGVNFIKFINDEQEKDGPKKFAISDGLFGATDLFGASNDIKMISNAFNDDQEAGARDQSGPAKHGTDNREVVIVRKNFSDFDEQTQLYLHAAFKDVRCKMSAIMKDELFSKFDNDINKSYDFFAQLLTALKSENCDPSQYAQREYEEFQNFIQNKRIINLPGKVGIYKLALSGKIEISETVNFMEFPLDLILIDLTGLKDLPPDQLNNKITDNLNSIAAASLKYKTKDKALLSQVNSNRPSGATSPQSGDLAMAGKEMSGARQ